MPAMVDSGPCSCSARWACGWCFRNPASQSLSKSRSSGLPQTRISPLTFCSGRYGASSAVGAPASALAPDKARKLANATTFASVWALGFTATLIELLQLFANVGSGNRRIHARLLDDFLALPAQHKPDEFPDFRIHRTCRRLVDVDIGVSSQRVASVLDVIGSERDGRALGSLRQRDHLQSAGTRALGSVRIYAGAVDWHERSPADAVLVLLERLVHPLADDRAAGGIVGGLFRFHVFLEVGIPFHRPVHHQALEVRREARRHVAVGLDLLVRPVTGEAELAPLADVLL